MCFAMDSSIDVNNNDAYFRKAKEYTYGLSLSATYADKKKDGEVLEAADLVPKI